MVCADRPIGSELLLVLSEYLEFHSWLSPDLYVAMIDYQSPLRDHQAA
jgi:hypothetical protein